MSSGQKIGKYTVEEQIGQGGMGVVLRATSETGQSVAIKQILPQLVSAESRQRLAREVDTLRRIDHPGVAKILDADLDAELPYIVTEFIDGPTLDEYVTAHGPLTGNELAQFGTKLGESIAHIHQVDVIHRDLKPTNILVRDGIPVVIDFGVAHIVDASRLTQTGLVMGTPGYLAPEIINNSPLSQAVDWWSWAATMVYAATGRHPFGTGTVQAVIARLQTGNPDLNGCPTALHDILHASLSQDPTARPKPPQLRVAMENFAVDNPPTALPETTFWAPDNPSHTRNPPTHQTPQQPAQRPDPEATTVLTSAPKRPEPVTYVPTPTVPPTTAAPIQTTSPVSKIQHRTHNWWTRTMQDPDRRAMLLAQLVTLGAIGTLAPAAAIAVGSIWAIAALVVTASMRILHRRNNDPNARGGSIAIIALSAPLRSISAALRLIVPLLIGIGLGLVVSTIIEVGFGAFAPITSAKLAALAATLVTTLSLWWGSIGLDLRYGSRVLWRSVTPQPGAASVILICLALVVIAAFLVAMGKDFSPSWWPFDNSPWKSLRDVITNFA